MTLSLYLLSRLDAVGYDECRGFVIAAPDEASARAVPFAVWELGDYDGCRDECRHIDRVVFDDDPQTPCAWKDPARTNCTCIGVAAPDVPRGIVLRSFAAG